MKTSNERSITQLISEWQQGAEGAFTDLIERVYPSVHSMARQRMSGEGPGHTLQPTALVNEALIALQKSQPQVSDSAHLRAIIALTMRRVLVDHARAARRQKRGGDNVRVTFVEDQQIGESQDLVDLIALDDLLNELAEFEPVGADMLCCHLFGGMTYASIAAHHNLSESTVHERLKLCRAWLRTRGL